MPLDTAVWRNYRSGMKTIRLVLLALFAMHSAAAPAADKLASIDKVAGLMTVETGGGLKTYRLKPFTEVKINGVLAKADQLRAGMNVTVTLADPQTASRIAAVGNVAPTATPGIAGATPRPPLGALTSPATGTRKITLRLKLDGGDLVRIQTGQLWIEHKSWDKPVNIVINGIPWEPQWTDNRSDRFFAFNPPLAPFGAAKIEVRKAKGRGSAEIKEPPTAENGETLTLSLADAGGGADDYEVRISW